MNVNRVVSTLAQKLAAVLLKVADQIPPLHAGLRLNDSRMTSLPSNSSSAR
jgi:hypothetical protein